MASLSRTFSQANLSAHEWNAIRPHFTRLYKDEGRTLVSIQQIMIKDYGFKATVNQYKKRIKRWKLAKYIKADEKLQMIAHLNSAGRRPQKDQEYELSGKAIAGSKLCRYEKTLENSAFNFDTQNNTAPDLALASACRIDHNSEGVYSDSSQTRVDHDLSNSDRSNTPEPSQPGPCRLDELAAWFIAWLWLGEWTFHMFDDTDFAAKLRSSPAHTCPSTEFLEWTKRFLLKTPATQDTVFLALLFVYRLKFQNPLVVCEPVFERRLFVTSLFLANKASGHQYSLQEWANATLLPDIELETMQLDFSNFLMGSATIRPEVWTSWSGKMKRLLQELPQVIDHSKKLNSHPRQHGKLPHQHPEMRTPGTDNSLSSAQPKMITTTVPGDGDIDPSPQAQQSYGFNVDPVTREENRGYSATENQDSRAGSRAAETGVTYPLSQGGILQFYDFSQDSTYQQEEAMGLQETLFAPCTKVVGSPRLSPWLPRLFSPVP